MSKGKIEFSATLKKQNAKMFEPGNIKICESLQLVQDYY